MGIIKIKYLHDSFSSILFHIIDNGVTLLLINTFIFHFFCYNICCGCLLYIDNKAFVVDLETLFRVIFPDLLDDLNLT